MNCQHGIFLQKKQPISGMLKKNNMAYSGLAFLKYYTFMCVGTTTRDEV
jgi:hypothetical protein